MPSSVAVSNPPKVVLSVLDILVIKKPLSFSERSRLEFKLGVEVPIPTETRSVDVIPPRTIELFCAVVAPLPIAIE